MSEHATDIVGHWHEAISGLQQRMLDGIVSGRDVAQLIEALCADIEISFDGLHFGRLPVDAVRDGIPVAHARENRLVAPVHAGDDTAFAWIYIAGRDSAVPRAARARLLAVCAHALEAAARHGARERELTYRAHFDALTGAANRALLRDRLASGVDRAGREGRSLSILFLDLDHFKAINDRHGHEAGDAVLECFARRVEAEVTECHLLARMGGDEFVLMIDEPLAPAGHEAVAERLLGVVNGIYAVGGRAIEVSASVGVGVYPQDGTSAEQLLRSADEALMAAKVAGRAVARRACAASMTVHLADRVRRAASSLEGELAN